jgi:hypothetical protein
LARDDRADWLFGAVVYDQDLAEVAGVGLPFERAEALFEPARVIPHWHDHRHEGSRVIHGGVMPFGMAVAGHQAREDERSLLDDEVS